MNSRCVALGAVRGASGNRVVFSEAVTPSVPPIWNKEANELTSAPFTQNSDTLCAHYAIFILERLSSKNFLLILLVH